MVPISLHFLEHIDIFKGASPLDLLFFFSLSLVIQLCSQGSSWLTQVAANTVYCLQTNCFTQNVALLGMTIVWLLPQSSSRQCKESRALDPLSQSLWAEAGGLPGAGEELPGLLHFVNALVLLNNHVSYIVPSPVANHFALAGKNLFICFTYLFRCGIYHLVFYRAACGCVHGSQRHRSVRRCITPSADFESGGSESGFFKEN